MYHAKIIEFYTDDCKFFDLLKIVLISLLVSLKLQIKKIIKKCRPGMSLDLGLCLRYFNALHPTWKRTVPYHNRGFLVAAVVLTGKRYLMVLFSCQKLNFLSYSYKNVLLNQITMLTLES